MNSRLYLALLGLIGMFSCDHLQNKWSIGSKAEHNIVDTVLYSQPTRIHFRDTMIDLGSVKEGTEKKIVYYYENAGNYPLVLFNVSPGCGCTIADFSHEPLASGKRDSIVAKFDSKGKEGSYIKNIKVNCNTEEKVHNIAFKVNVVK